MSYCLVKIGDAFEISDRSEIKGPHLEWRAVKVKKGKDWADAIYVGSGKQKEMEETKRKWENGELKAPRPKKKDLFSIGLPCVEEEEDVDEPPVKIRPTRAAALRAVKVEKEDEEERKPVVARKGKRACSLPPADAPLSLPTVLSHLCSTVPTPTATVSSPSPPSNPGTVTLDIIYRKLCNMEESVNDIKSRQERIEAKQREIYNDVVGIRHESKTVVEKTAEAASKIVQLTDTVQKLKERMPQPQLAPQYGIYPNLTEKDVARIDIPGSRLLVFAGKLDKILFENSSLPHQERDKDKLEWLIKVVLHRRSDSVMGEGAKWRSLILQRINVNASRVDDKEYDQALVDSQPAFYTPPTLVSTTRLAPLSHITNSIVPTPSIAPRTQLSTIRSAHTSHMYPTVTPSSKYSNTQLTISQTPLSNRTSHQTRGTLFPKTYDPNYFV